MGLSVTTALLNFCYFCITNRLFFVHLKGHGNLFTRHMSISINVFSFTKLLVSISSINTIIIKLSVIKFSVWLKIAKRAVGNTTRCSNYKSVRINTETTIVVLIYHISRCFVSEQLPHKLLLRLFHFFVWKAQPSHMKHSDIQFQAFWQILTLLLEE